MIKCDCDERTGIEINSWKQFQELKMFFDEQIEKKIFIEVPVEQPHYVGYSSNGNALKWYADKWYKCVICGALWEFVYPDFPAKGFVRKFEDGIYQVKE